MAETNASAVRDAADLIYAAEILLDQSLDATADTVAAIDRIARAAKALRANHLDDALAHVAARAEWIATERARWVPGDSDHPVTVDPTGRSDRDARHEAAVDEIVLGAGAEPVPETPDVAALRDRVRGDDG